MIFFITSDSETVGAAKANTLDISVLFGNELKKEQKSLIS